MGALVRDNLLIEKGLHILFAMLSVAFIFLIAVTLATTPL
jgi:hypothetical protein